MRYKYHIQGDIAEAKAVLLFTTLGFFIYAPLSNLAPYDFIAVKDGTMYRIQVKSSSNLHNNGGHRVDLRSTNPLYNKGFDNSNSDILVCYLVLLDTLCFIRSSDIKTKTMVIFRENLSGPHKSKQLLISDHTDITKVLNILNMDKSHIDS